MRLKASISRYCAAVFLLLIFAWQSALADVFEKSAEIAGIAVEYAVVVPKGYDPAKAYPAVLAFPGGSQDMDTVEGTLARNWMDEAERRGYIVIIPAAPNGHLFFREGDKVFPEFLTKLLADYKVLGNKFHIAGLSNGGVSAFHIAASYPQYFWSVTGFPGYLPGDSPERVHALAKMCIYMFAGEYDTGWAERMGKQAELFRSQGLSVNFSIEPGQGHMMQTLAGASAGRLFDQFEQARKGCGK